MSKRWLSFIYAADWSTSHPVKEVVARYVGIYGFINKEKTIEIQKNFRQNCKQKVLRNKGCGRLAILVNKNLYISK